VVGDAVATGAFAVVERDIGLVDEAFGGLRARGEGGGTEAGGDGAEGPGVGSYGVAETFGEEDNVGSLGEGENDDELFTAVARYEIGFAGVFAEEVGHGAEHIVACGMAVGVVVLFEVIDIEEDEREGEIVASGALELFVEAFFEDAPVFESGEAVEGCEGFEEDVGFVQAFLLLANFFFVEFSLSDIAERDECCELALPIGGYGTKVEVDDLFAGEGHADFFDFAGGGGEGQRGAVQGFLISMEKLFGGGIGEADGIGSVEDDHGIDAIFEQGAEVFLGDAEFAGLLLEFVVEGIEFLLGSNEFAVLLDGVFVCGEEEVEHLPAVGGDEVMLSFEGHFEAGVGFDAVRHAAIDQERLDAVEQIFRVVGFSEVVIGVAFEPFEDAGGVGESGEEDDGDGGAIGVGFESEAHFIPVHDGHVDVAEDHIGRVCAGEFEGFCAIGGDGGVVAVVLEELFKNERLGWAILDDENIRLARQ